MLPLVGLVNDSSVCYLNSLLQCLMANDKFNKQLKKIPENNVINAYITLLNGINFHFKRIQKPFKVNPTGIKSVLFENSNLIKGRQEDADETLVLLLDKIGNENNKYFKSSIRTYMKCFACQHNSFKDEELYQIYLDISHERSTVYNCLNNYIKPEELVGYKCDNCGDKSETKKALLPINFGDNIVFVIKQYQKSYRRIPLQTLEEIDLGDYLFDESNKKQNISRKYHLVGAILHLGGTGGGHYQSICKKTNDLSESKWYLFDDEHFEQLDDLEQINNAYMLFYEVCD